MITIKGKWGLRDLCDRLRDTWMDVGDIPVAVTITTLNKNPKPSKWHRVDSGETPADKEILLYNNKTGDRGYGWVGLTMDIKDHWTHWREWPKLPKKAGENETS